jgi:DNA-binding SARP family transcriptional activator
VVATRAQRVDVTVLGHPAITGADPQRTLRAKSQELLVYLVVHDGDATVEAILDDLLPDAPASKAMQRLHTYVSDLRAALRHAGGPGTYLTHPHHRYTLVTDRIDADLWRMRAALRQAQRADTDPARIAALRHALDAYRAPLVDGCDYEWIEPYREGARQQALDAALALVDLLADRPADQLAVLDTAIEHHRSAEALYQAAMRVHAALGHLDAIRALRRTLTQRLAEIDAEPGDDTLTLADNLVTGLQRPGTLAGRRRPGSADGVQA